MKMKYFYLYYRIYFLFSRGNEGNNGAVLSSLVLSKSLFFNIMAVGGFMLKFGLIDFFIDSKFESVALIMSIFLINLLIFNRNKNYQKIYDLFSNESRRKKIIGSILILLYGFLSFGLFIISAMYTPGIGIKFAD
jgi:hypothetical protein